MSEEIINRFLCENDILDNKLHNAKHLIKLFDDWKNSKKIFLSHSHFDIELVKSLKLLFNNLDIKLYIDWLDTSMPEKPNKITALKIKQEIEISDHVFVLATKNAMKSKWVPWEIGIADLSKSNDGITVIPILADDKRFYGYEYLELYNHIEFEVLQNQLLVFNTDKTKMMLLENWLMDKFL